MSTQYRVRVPDHLRPFFGGQDRLTQRFEDPAMGRAWVAQQRAVVSTADADLRHNREASAVGIARGPEMTFADACQAWITTRNLRPKTARWYKDHVQAHILGPLGLLRLSGISRAVLADHLAARRKAGSSASNVARDVTIVQAVIRWAADQGWRVDPSALLVKKLEVVPIRTKRYDPDMVERLLAAVGPRDRVILEVAAFTGMRRGELRAFACDWIRWDEGRIHVPHDVAFQPKSGRARSIPLLPRVREALARWLAGRRSGPVFPPMKTRADHQFVDVRRIFRKLNPGGGFSGWSCHDLRHHFLSFLAAHGVKARIIQEIAGHRSSSTTDRYTHVQEGYWKDVIEAVTGEIGRGVGSDMGSGKKSGKGKSRPEVLPERLYAG